MTENRSLRVFLCHSSKDSAVARELFHQLNAEEWLDIWFVEDRLLPSQDWGPEIIKGARNADVVILLVSKKFHEVDTHRYPRWGFVSNALDEKVFVVPLLLDENEIPEGFKAWGSINFYPRNKRKVIFQNIIKSLKIYAEQLGISISKRSSGSAPEKSVQWTPSLWKQIDDTVFEKDTEPESPAPRLNQARQRLKKNIFRGFNHLFLWGASLGTLLVLLIGGLTVNYLVKGGTTNSFTAPFVSRALTLVPLPTPTLGVGSVRVSTLDGMRLLYVPEGEFKMGSNEHQNDEQPEHHVHLDEFWIDQYEVTNGMYAKCVEAKACGLPRPTDVSWIASSPDQDFVLFGPEDSKFFDQLATDPEFFNQPVMNVPWDYANAYCQWVGRRLPTEAEWEKAARGVDGRTYPWGEEVDCSKANLFSCAGTPSRVGSFEEGQSPYGAYDMAGNALEWVADWYDGSYYEESPYENPLGPTTGLYRVYRGGSWGSGEASSRVTNRPGYIATLPLDFIGFRCATSNVAVVAQTNTPVPTADIVSWVSDIDGMRMMYVSGGGFIMGSNYFEEDESPAHKVYLDAYWMDEHEVTNQQYAMCVNDGKCTPPFSYYQSDNQFLDPVYNNHPVTGASWNDAAAYCAWAGRRLPTEAQWEKAARGESGNRYPWGEWSPSERLLNFNVNVGGTTPVKSYEAGASPYRVYDMAGNVWEWVRDWYDNEYYWSSPSENPLGPDSGNLKILRGGSWGNSGNTLRASNRHAPLAMQNLPLYVGFRCAMAASE